MENWQPTTADKVQAIVDDELPQCTLEQQAVFNKHRVPLRRTPIKRYGQIEFVYVAAERDGEVMYYEDVEMGWNFSPLSPEGYVAEHGCNQDELMYALWRWTPRSG